MNLIIRAAQLADQLHRGQARKYTGAPYILHPARVASRVCLLPGVDEIAVASAWLHDTMEDCGATQHVFEEAFGSFDGCQIAIVVSDLTNTSKQANPQMNRAQRKAVDRERISGISSVAQDIKCIDRIDNLMEMSGAPVDFRELYLHESQLLLAALWKANQTLRDELSWQIVLGARDLNAPTAAGGAR